MAQNVSVYIGIAIRDYYRVRGAVVRFHESLWRRKGDGLSPVSRETLMVALQKTTLVLIRATEAADTRLAE